MVNIILSPYFSENTKLVASFCRKCYSEEKEDDIVVTAVNLKFLEIYDPKRYQIFTNNFILIPCVKIGVPRSKEKRVLSIKHEQSKLKLNQQFSRYRNLTKIKQGILKKYFKLNWNSTSSNRNRVEKLEETLDRNVRNSSIEQKHRNCNADIDMTTKIEKENNEKQFKKESTSQKQPDANIENKALIKVQIKTDNDQESINLKKELQKHTKLEKIDGLKERSKWIPPISPHNLIEEKYYNDPWALIVVTIFLNKTSCILALPYIEKFFEDFKGPYDVLKVEVCSLEPYFTKIGLIKTRANQVWRMSRDFVQKDWKHVSELFGVGKYAEDAYRMFHLGDFSVEPTDRYLKIYKAWYEMKQRNEKLGIIDCNSQVYLEDYFIAPECEDRTEDVEESC